MEENMTDFQLETVLEMLASIINGSKDLEEAKQSIRDLLDESE